MVIVQEPICWIGGSDFGMENPIRCTILGFEQQPHKTWKDKMDNNLKLSLDYQPIQHRYISVFGQNLSALITAYGANSDFWINRKISIMQTESTDGKKVKTITCL